MTDLRQAAQQALDALEELDGLDTETECVTIDVGDVIAALRTALEQQAEPVAWMDREGDLYKMPEIKNWAPPHTMLYTTPPQRQWVGLTDELEAAFKDGWQSAKAAHGIKEGHDLRTLWLSTSDARFLVVPQVLE